MKTYTLDELKKMAQKQIKKKNYRGWFESVKQNAGNVPLNNAIFNMAMGSAKGVDMAQVNADNFVGDAPGAVADADGGIGMVGMSESLGQDVLAAAKSHNFTKVQTNLIVDIYLMMDQYDWDNLLEDVYDIFINSSYNYFNMDLEKSELMRQFIKEVYHPHGFDFVVKSLLREGGKKLHEKKKLTEWYDVRPTDVPVKKLEHNGIPITAITVEVQPEKQSDWIRTVEYWPMDPNRPTEYHRVLEYSYDLPSLEKEIDEYLEEKEKKKKERLAKIAKPLQESNLMEKWNNDAQSKFKFLKNHDSYDGEFSRDVRVWDLDLTEEQEDVFGDYLLSDGLEFFWEANKELSKDIYQVGRQGGHLVLEAEDAGRSPTYYDASLFQEADNLDDLFDSFLMEEYNTYLADIEDEEDEEYLENVKSEFIDWLDGAYDAVNDFDDRCDQLIENLKKDLDKYAEKHYYADGEDGDAYDVEYGYYDVDDEDEDIDESISRSPKSRNKKLHESSSDDYVELHYDDLHLEVEYGNRRWSDGSYEHYYEDYIDYDYRADLDDVKDLIIDYVCDDDPSLADYSDEEFDKYIDDHFDELVEKYEDDLLEDFREKAEIEAAENWDESDIYEEPNDIDEEWDPEAGEFTGEHLTQIDVYYFEGGNNEPIFSETKIRKSGEDHEDFFKRVEDEALEKMQEIKDKDSLTFKESCYSAELYIIDENNMRYFSTVDLPSRDQYYEDFEKKPLSVDTQKKLIKKVAGNKDALKFILKHSDFADEDIEDVEEVILHGNAAIYFSLDTFVRDQIMDGIEAFLNTSSKSSKEIFKKFRGCKDVVIIDNGPNSDPELSFVDEDGIEHIANYYDVEDMIYDYYLRSRTEMVNPDKEEDDFNKFCADHEEDIKDYIYNNDAAYLHEGYAGACLEGLDDEDPELEKPKYDEIEHEFNCDEDCLDEVKEDEEEDFEQEVEDSEDIYTVMNKIDNPKIYVDKVNIFTGNSEVKKKRGYTDQGFEKVDIDKALGYSPKKRIKYDDEALEYEEVDADEDIDFSALDEELDTNPSIEEIERQIKALKDERDFLTKQAPREIKKGGAFDSQEEIDEALEETNKELKRMYMMLDIAKRGNL